MDTATRAHEHTVFHVTGQRAGGGLAELTAEFRPALFAPLRDLAALRYDFPVLLRADAPNAGFAQPLASVIGELAAAVAPRGIDGERMRRLLLRAERELRTLAARGGGTLAALWPVAAARAAGDDDVARELLKQAGAALPVDGEVFDCTARFAGRFALQAWRSVTAERAARFQARTARLISRLDDILRAAYAHSAAGRRPEALAAGFGALHRDTFDFSAMSRLVARHVPMDELPAARRRRIEWALGVLRNQPLYPATGDDAANVFDSCAAALAAHRARLPRIAEVLKALAVGELEADGAYVEDRHDMVLARHDEHALTGEDLAAFSPLLVCIPPERNDAPENASLMELLSAGVPVKIVVQHTDLLEDAAIGQGHFAFGVRSARLATTAMGLGGVFVLQTASSNLVALRQRVRDGMAAAGPALFSVFAGAPPEASALPPYLTSAAAMKSRAFPAFTYDAAAGDSWATRFSLENNRAPDADWPEDVLHYADDDLQRAELPVRFTYADFVLCDRRHAHHFAVVPRERWTSAMLPAADWLALSEAEAAERVPYVLAVDEQDGLHRVLVDARLMQAARRCLMLWHRLQEHGGRRGAPAVAVAPVAPVEPAAAAPAAAPAAAVSAAEAAAPEPTAAAPASDDPWIETARCSSCNECRNINDRMFGYNANQQAFIADVTAGTYRQLVEAAEACQVAIIHPGKPKNPHEADLDALLERARLFQ
jgi:hypothetical protein